MNLSELPFRQPLVAIFFAHKGDPLSGVINFLTHGPASHAGWLRSDQKTIWEAYYPQVHTRPLMEAEKPGIALFTLEGMTPEIAAKLERYFDITQVPGLVPKYSIMGLVDYEFCLTPENPQNIFCSQAVLQSIRKNAVELLPVVRVDDDASPPNELYHAAKLHLVEWE